MRPALLSLTLLFVLSPAGPALSQGDFLFPDGIASGDVTSAGALLWTRRQPGLPVTVEVASDPAFGAVVFSATTTPEAERGGTVKLLATALAPGTRHHFRFSLGGGIVSGTGTFVTAPRVDTSAEVRFAFSGDADGTRVDGRPVHPFTLLDAVTADRPDFFLMVGDTIYADSGRAARAAATLPEYRQKYRESQAQRPLQGLRRGTPLVVIWDDHEVQNDFDRETVNPARFAAAHQAFSEAWPITEQPEGRLYRSFRWGRDVEVFILDTRSYRSRQVSKTRACANPPGGRIPDLAPALPARLRATFRAVVRQFAAPVPAGCLTALADPGRTLLGPAQKAWLKAGLQRSAATWKFIVTSVPIQEFFALPYDRWEGYPAERAEILDFIRTGGVKNVVWLAADTHAVLVNDVRADTFRAPPAAAGMKEVVAGPIATTPFGEEMAEVLGPLAPAAFAAFLRAAPPDGLGATCAVIDRFTYALVQVNGRTVTITPKDAAGRPVCRAPLVMTAAP